MPGPAPLSSEPAVVEVLRSCARLDPALLPDGRALLRRVDLLPLTHGIVQSAAELPDPLLRTLDALHLASALSVREHLSALVAYDHRLAAVASASGLPVEQPGAR